MVLRPDAIRERLLRLEEVISELDGLRAMGEAAVHGTLRDRWSVERGLQLGAETLFEIGQHILSARFGVAPQDYEDIVPQLAARGVVTPELANRLKGLGGFRNLLVHEYARLDPVRVLENLSRAPTDFGDFIAAIRRWLEATT